MQTRTHQQEGAGPAAPGSAAAALSGPAAVVLGLQRTAGNAAAAGLLARQGSDQSSAGGVPVVTPPAAGGDDVASAIKDKDIGRIKSFPVSVFTSATADQRYQMMEVLLDQAWVGPMDEYALEAIWNAFGTSGIADAYAAKTDLWNRCVDAGAELADIPALVPVRTAWESDVKAVAKAYMEKNRQLIVNEGNRLGLGDLAKGTQAPGGPDQKAIAKTQEQAGEVQRADEALGELGALPVGYDYDTVDHPGGVHKTTKEVATYGSGQKPMIPPRGDEKPPFAKYDDVDRQYRAVSRGRAALVARNPALFAIAGEGHGAAGKFAAMSPQAAAEKLRAALGTTLKNITETQPKLDTGDLDWRDLVPIHTQLYEGLPSQSATQWSKPLNKEVAKDVIGDHQATEFWIALGLGTISAVAFILSEIATAGLATFLWATVAVAASGAQAAISWEKYEDLATAAGSAASEETRLVDSGQVTDAAIAAVMDTAFAFLDVYAAAKGIAKAVAKVAAREALEGLSKLGAAEAKQAVETAVKELGPQETIRRSGKSAEELAGIVGRETEAGKALEKAAGDLTALPEAAGGLATGDVAPSPEARKLAGRLSGLMERWGTMPPEVRLAELVREVNADLAHTGMPKLKPEFLDGVTTRGKMSFPLWEVGINRDLVSGATITAEEFAKLVGTLRHEAEHGLQWFRMAQLEAMSGKNAAEIAKKLSIPHEVAEAAIEVQNGFRKGIPIVAGSALETEARRFFDSVYGANRLHRRAVYAEKKAAAAELKEASAQRDALKNAADGDPAKAAAEARVQAASTRKAAAHRAYLDLPEEVAARAAGDEAASAMRERLMLTARLGAARTAEKEAFEAFRPLEDLYVGTAGKPSLSLTYPKLLEYHHALDRWKAAMDAVFDIDAALARTAGGGAP